VEVSLGIVLDDALEVDEGSVGAIENGKRYEEGSEMGEQGGEIRKRGKKDACYLDDRAANVSGITGGLRYARKGTKKECEALRAEGGGSVTDGGLGRI